MASKKIRNKSNKTETDSDTENKLVVTGWEKGGGRRKVQEGDEEVQTAVVTV